MIKAIRNKILLMLAEIIDKKIDGKEITKKLDVQMDKSLGKISEKLQRGPITSILIEMIQGLWEESPDDLKAYLKHKLSL